MKKFGMSLMILAVAALVSSAVIAQPPGGGDRGAGRGAEGERGRGDGPPPRREGDGPPPRRDGEGGRPGEGGRGGERGFGPPPNPVMMALDADGDHVISAEEIKNASKALASLDKNKDGKLTQDELRPDFGGRGPGPGGFDGPPPRRDGEGGRGGERGRPGEGQQGRPGNSSEFLDRVMSFDEDKDGKLSRKEMPERMQRMLDRGDANKDGALDRDELKKMFEQFQGGQGGRPPRDGDRPPRDGDRPPRDGDRPPRDGDGEQRPRRPAAEE
ncbi:MAG: EF-hand domain-containing protein [Rhodopirellula sp.]|nr:EF-hand domain-containing protein [Rhodopirellula sp.]